MEAPDDFYVELPSNSSNNIFPDNTHANYKVKLARPLMLTEDYEVALMEAFFLKNWHNIVREDGNISVTSNGVAWEFTIESDLYEKPKQLINAINQTFFRIVSPHVHAQLHETVSNIPKKIAILQKEKANILTTLPTLEK